MRRELLETPRLGAQGGVMGRPRSQPPAYIRRPIREAPPENVERVIEECAAQFMSLRRIAIALGTSEEVLRRWIDEDPVLRWAYDAGRAQAEYEQIMLVVEGSRNGDKPNVNAMFILKAMFGWREGEQANVGNRVNIFNLQAPLPLNDFLKKVKSDDNG